MPHKIGLRAFEARRSWGWSSRCRKRTCSRITTSRCVWTPCTISTPSARYTMQILRPLWFPQRQIQKAQLLGSLSSSQTTTCTSWHFTNLPTPIVCSCPNLKSVIYGPSTGSSSSSWDTSTTSSSTKVRSAQNHQDLSRTRTTKATLIIQMLKRYSHHTNSLSWTSK